MNIAVILAGGIGNRMSLKTPKQFVKINGKPVLGYTLECFQAHPLVDAIEVVCVEGWDREVRSIAESLGITKLRYLVPGGSTSQESIRNGVYALEGVCAPDDTVIIHDGIRPLLDTYVLTDVIEKSALYGAAVSSLPYNEQIFVTDPAEPDLTGRYVPRETVRRVSTPQAYRFSLLDEKYHEAEQKHIGYGPSAYANTMMADLGVKLYLAAGSEKNIKLTTPPDLTVFRAFLAAGTEDGRE